jgi:hypothetical protein
MMLAGWKMTAITCNNEGCYMPLLRSRDGQVRWLAARLRCVSAPSRLVARACVRVRARVVVVRRAVCFCMSCACACVSARRSCVACAGVHRRDRVSSIYAAWRRAYASLSPLPVTSFVLMVHERSAARHDFHTRADALLLPVPR